jgi:hypothetical protein
MKQKMIINYVDVTGKHIKFGTFIKVTKYFLVLCVTVFPICWITFEQENNDG